MGFTKFKHTSFMSNDYSGFRLSKVFLQFLSSLVTFVSIKSDFSVGRWYFQFSFFTLDESFLNFICLQDVGDISEGRKLRIWNRMKIRTKLTENRFQIGGRNLFWDVNSVPTEFTSHYKNGYSSIFLLF